MIRIGRHDFFMRATTFPRTRSISSTVGVSLRVVGVTDISPPLLRSYTGSSPSSYWTATILPWGSTVNT